MTVENVFKSGDYYLLCDVCGFKIRFSESYKRWDGAMVCAKDYEERHPLDFIQPPQPSHIPEDVRNPEPVFLTDNEVQPEDL